MLHGSDRGCRAFMGCDMGLGIFTAEAGPNRLAIHQGANEGFRAVFIHCYAGPDRGQGLVLFCNADNRGVLMIAEMARELLGALGIRGIDFERMRQGFDFTGLAPEQIVNLGYKRLIFDAFEPDLPEAIVERGPPDPLAARNLAVGARLVGVSDQRFARAENLISDHLPRFDPELYGRQGKIMDSWETVRHNPASCDWLELELRRPAPIRYASLSTKFHDGNQPQAARLLGRVDGEWREFLPKTPLAGHALLRVRLAQATPAYARIRVEIFPDGGLSRLQLFEDLPADPARDFEPLEQAQARRFPGEIPKSRKPLTLPYAPTPEEIRSNPERAPEIDWAGAAFGARITHASNEHYSPASQVISPFPPLHMFDGMESARSREPGHHEEIGIRLARPVRVESIWLDFTWFVNNNPREISIEGLSQGRWRELVPRTGVKAFAGNQRRFGIGEVAVIEELRVKTYPDGGINRIRVRGSAV
jgi:allantoicase